MIGCIAHSAQSGIITDGLKLWLDASNPASYPGSGTAWNDLSGNNNHGTLMPSDTNKPTFLPTTNGGVMSFDGVDDYVSTELSIQSYNNFAISLVLKPERVNGIQVVVGIFTSGSLLWIGLNENRLVFATAGSNDLYSTTLVNTNNFYHVTFVREGSIKKIYVNGILESQGPSGFLPVGNITFGKFGNSSYNSKGLFNDFLVYNKSLSAIENDTNFNATKSKYGL